MDFKKQAGINSIGSVVLMFAQWLISVLLVRMGGYEDAGVFSLAMSMSNVFSFFASYGMRNYQVSDVKGKFTQGQYVLAHVLLVAIAISGCIIYLLTADGYSAIERKAILLYLLYSCVNVFSDTFLGTLQLRGKLQINGYSNAMRGAICFIAFLLTYCWTNSLLIAMAAMILGTVVLTITYDLHHYSVYEHLTTFTMQDLKSSAKLIKVCFALMISNILPVITTALPRRSIQKIAGTEQLGYFSSIFTPTVLITTLLPAIVIALIPKMAEAWEKRDKKSLTQLAGQTYVICMAFVLLAELAALIVGRPVMALIFGSEILQYYSLLYWAILATGLNALTSCGSAVLIAMHYNRIVAISSFVALATTFFLSDTFVKEYGIDGAAYALTIAYFAQVAFQTIAVKIKIHRVHKEPNC